MNDELHLSLFGHVVIKRNGVLVTGFRSRAVPALLVYLVCTGRPHSRETLADLLWEARSTKQSLSNLRTVLTLFHKQLGNHFIITRETVAFDPASHYWLDTHELQAQLDALQPHSSSGGPMDLSPAIADQLQKALRLYQGDFLSGFHLRDAPRFNEWVVVEQERLRRMVIGACQQLVAFYLTQGDYQVGIKVAARWISLEPYGESAHGQMMKLLALSGQRSAALAQYEACRRILREELGIQPDTVTTSLYERIRSGEFDPKHVASAASRSSVTISPPHRLPPHAHRTPLIGREAELAMLDNLFANSSIRLVTITGLGGMGKTRLAVSAAEQQWRASLSPSSSELRFPDGVFFVPLAQLNSAEQIVPALAKALNLPLVACQDVPPGAQSGTPPCSLEQQFFDYLRPQRLLLVLDDMEHLVEGGSELLADILREAPGVRILVTSQEPMQLPEEQICPIQGLVCPNWKTTVKVSGDDFTTQDGDAADCITEECPAFKLFLVSARRVQPDFSLKADDWVSLAHICYLVMGMPLGIELAASWVDTLSLADIAAQIEDSLGSLKTVLRHIPDRHKSLLAVLDYAWRRLSLAEQSAFSQLAVFRGGFQLAAAEAVLGACLPMLAALVKKSLLLYDRSTGRYQLHDLLRHYAADKLAQAPNLEAIARDRHSAYYCAILQDRAEYLQYDRQTVALATIEAETSNVHLAWEWAVAQAQLDRIEHGLYGLKQFYLSRGRFLEGEVAFRQAAERVRSLGHADGDLIKHRQTLLGKLLVAQTDFLLRLDRYAQAIAAAREAIELVQRLSEEQAQTGLLSDVGIKTLQTSEEMRVKAGGHLAWGEALLLQGEYQAAQSHLQQALSQARASRASWLEASSLVCLGRCLSEQCDYAQARSSLEQAWQIHSQTGNRVGEMLALANLGALVQSQGHDTTASIYYEQALSIAREIGSRHDEGRLLGRLGAAAQGWGDSGKALAHCAQAQRIAIEVHDRRGEGYALHHLGIISACMGKYSQALDYYQRALNINREIGNRHAEAWVLADLGSLHRHLHEREAALEHHQRTLHLAQELELQTAEGIAWARLGQDWEDMGQLANAKEAYQHALAVRCELGEQQWMRDAVSGLARVAFAQGDLERAYYMAQDILVYLERAPLNCVHNLVKDYLTCYRILQANRDTRASSVLATAYRLLEQQAETIGDYESEIVF